MDDSMRTSLIRPLLVIAALCAVTGLAVAAEKPAQPNIVIILADDMGYGDLACYGHPTIATPNLDHMAAEGMKLTQFYVAASVCTPSRAALLTGRYPIRSGMTQVLIPKSKGGLPATEITLGDALKKAGYATACIGKWHLGSLKEHLPLNHGFDYYFGLPYSNDMSPWAQPTNHTFDGDPPHPLYRNFEVISRGEPDQSQLTRWYTDEALKFIRTQAGKKKPFFLYLAHTFPHVPLAASGQYKGKSRRGLYGDTVEEIDGSCGEVFKTLKELGLDDNTLVMFTSDNGPWIGQKLDGGSPGPFTEGKVSTWEGGFREPAIFRWPGKIPAGVTTRAFATAMDLLPTLVGLAGGEVPGDREIDGVDLAPVLFKNEPGREPLMFYYFNAEVWAVRKGPWKIHLKTVYPAASKKWGDWPVTEHNPPLLFNVDEDPGEKYNVAEAHPEIVAELAKLIEQHKAATKPGVSQK